MFRKISLKKFTIISILIYIVICYFGIRTGLFGYRTVIRNWTYTDSLVKRSLNIWGHLVLCFPVFYAKVGLILADNKKRGLMGNILIIIFCISLVVIIGMILAGSSNVNVISGNSGLYLDVLIISSILFFNISKK